KTRRANRVFQINKSNRTKGMSILSYNDQKQPIKGFFYKKTFDTAQNKTRTVSKSPYSSKNFTTDYFDTQNRLYYSVDSSANHTNITHIFYGPSNRIDSIVFLRFSAHQHKENIYNFHLPDTTTEKHIYRYTPDGVLTRMEQWRNKHLYKKVY